MFDMFDEEIEEETHFMLDCSMYEDLRRKMFEVFQHTLSKQQRYQANPEPIEIEKMRKEEEGRRKLMAGLMGDMFASDNSVRAAALCFCKRAMKRRNRIVRTLLDQRT